MLAGKCGGWAACSGRLKTAAKRLMKNAGGLYNPLIFLNVLTEMNQSAIVSKEAAMQLLKDCVPIFTVLADENRHLILKLLLENGEMNVNQLTENLHLSRPAVSHHLKIMLAAHAVSVRQIGKERFYALAMKEEVQKMSALVEVLAFYCPDRAD